MTRERRAGGVWLLVVVFAVALALAALPLLLTPAVGTLRLVRRAAPLLGYQALFLSIITAAAPAATRRWLGVRFEPLHHFLAKTGFLLLSAHAIAVALDFATASVLLPQWHSLRAFLQWGGSPAWCFIFAGLVTAYLPRVFRRAWRPVHLLTYPAFYLASAHGLMLGIDLQRPLAKAAILAMVVAVTVALVWRQWQARRGPA